MTDLIAEAITEWFGPRCETKDVADFPDLAGKPDSRCPACLAWEQYDEMKAAQRKAPAKQAAQVLLDDLLSPPREGDIQGWQRAFAAMNETPGEMWKRFAAALRALAQKDSAGQE